MRSAFPFEVVHRRRTHLVCQLLIFWGWVPVMNDFRPFPSRELSPTIARMGPRPLRATRGEYANATCHHRWGADSAPWILLMLTAPRSGSSYLMSLLGESPEVLPLFELFNDLAHLNIYSSELRDVAIRHLHAEFGTHSDFGLRAAMAADPLHAVSAARRLAALQGKRWLAFKIFDWQLTGAFATPTLIGALRVLAGDPKVIVLRLRRSFFHRLASGTKGLVCGREAASWLRYNSTACQPRIAMPWLSRAVETEVLGRSLLRRALDGTPPFSSRPLSISVRYEELLPLQPQRQVNLVRERLWRVSGTTPCAYRLTGRTTRRYLRQDSNAHLSGKITNYAEVRSAAHRLLRRCGSILTAGGRPGEAAPAELRGYCESTLRELVVGEEPAWRTERATARSS